MGLALTTITDAIAGLTVTGLAIKDIDEIPTIYDGRTPIIYPEPVDLITNFEAIPATNGSGSTRAWDVTYDLRYTLLYPKIGASRGMELIKPTIDLALDFMDAIIALTTLSSAVTLKPGAILTPGPMNDPSGNQAFGVQVTLRVLEFVN